MFFLASCCSDDNVERRLTNTQKETYGQNISGEYPGEYIIIYKDKDCTDMTIVVAGTGTWVRHRRPRKFVKYLAVSSIFLLSFKELHYKIW